MRIDEFVSDVLIQLSPFLAEGTKVDFDLTVGVWCDSEESDTTAWRPVMGHGNNRIRFSIVASNSEAIEQRHGI